MSVTVVDYYSPHDRSFMDCLAKNHSVAGIARYLTNSASDPRQITPQEISDAHAAGLAVHFFYEMNPTYAGYFTFAQGAEDCRQAVYRLRELGAPAGTIVYFAVDTNIDPALADEYFNGVESMATPEITPGLYGFQRMVEHARAKYPLIGKHLAQTYGRPQGIGVLDLWQHEQLALCGVSVDLNECSVAGWRPKEENMDSPQYAGQSAASIVLRVGEVSPLEGIWRYANGTTRTQVEKVHGRKPGHWAYLMYPKVDQDADETRDLSAQPAIFVVTVTDL